MGKKHALDCDEIRQIVEHCLPHVQRVKFGILCAQQVYCEKTWNNWAHNWLANRDRDTIHADQALDKARGVEACEVLYSSASNAARAAGDAAKAATNAGWYEFATGAALAASDASPLATNYIAGMLKGIELIAEIPPIQKAIKKLRGFND